MRMLKMALAVACAVASTSAAASVVGNETKSTASEVSTCYYMYTIITPDGVYDVYECYGNGDGTY